MLHDEEEREDAKFKQHWTKKLRRKSSECKIGEGDKLCLKENSKFAAQMTKNCETKLVLSDLITKINRKGRPQERILIVTDGAIYNAEPVSVKVRRRIQLSNISHVSTSLLSDNFFVIHVPTEYDYLFVSPRKTEIIGALRQAYSVATKEELQLVMQNIVDYRIDKEQHRRLVFEQGEGGVYTRLYAKKAR